MQVGASSIGAAIFAKNPELADALVEKAKSKNNILFNNIDTDENFYFVHSYYFNSFNKKNILATSIYEETFASAIRKDNVFGVQFHPEKSQKSGMKLLKNFLKI